MLSLTSISQKNIFDNIDYYRVSTNYNGSAYNGRTILAYGEGGVIVRSGDGGNNWSQVNMNDSFNIVSITNIGNDFYGAVNKQYIIKSSDDGINWQEFDYGNNTEFYKIIAFNNYLYSITNTGIYVFNTNFEKLKEYSLNTDTNYYDFTIAGNNIIYSAGHGKLGIINLQNDNANIIDLKNLGLCTDCPVVKNLFSDGDMTYFELGNNLYQYDGNNVDFIFIPIKKGIYTSYNGNLYELYNIINTSTNLDSLYFIKIDKQNHNYTHIKKEGNDRYISSLNFKKISFLTSDIIIAVGSDKLIYMSYDKGKNWQLKSHFNISNDLGDIFRFDNENANCISYSHAKFLKTINSGTTWLPQTIYDPIYLKKWFGNYLAWGAAYFKDKMNGFVFGTSFLQQDANFIYTNDGGETIKLKTVNEINAYVTDKQTLISSNNNNTLMSFQGEVYELQYSLIFKLDDTLGIERLSYLDSMQILYFDTYKNDELVVIAVTYKYPRDSSKYTVYDSLYYSLITSNDGGKTWIRNVFDFYLYHSVSDNLYDKRINNNLIIYYTYHFDDKKLCDIYKLDLNTKSLIKLFSKESIITSGTNGISSIGNKIYIRGIFSTDSGTFVKLYENVDIENNPNEWNDVTPKLRYSLFSMVVQKDSLIYMTAYDSLMKSNVMWFAKPKKVTNVEEEIEVSNYLYLTKPYPNPSLDYVKTKIYWDTSNNINDVIIEVYDIIGNIVSDKK